MYCSKCGDRQVEGATICATCGMSFARPSGDTARAYAPLTFAAEVREDIQDPKLMGVGGWLAVLVLGMVVIGPSLTLLNLYQEYKVLQPLLSTVQLARRVLYIEAVSSVFVALGFAAAGVSLALKKEGAPAFARAVLLLQVPITALNAMALANLPGLDPQLMQGYGAEAVKGIAQSMISAAIWVSYLNRSKRVRATFGDWAKGRSHVLGEVATLCALAIAVAVFFFGRL